LPRRAVAVMTQHEDRALPAVEPIDRSGQPRAPLPRQESVRWIGGRAGGRRASFVRVGDFAAHEPAIAAASRLAPIETAVDENPCKPDLERPGLTIGANVRKDLEEGVLD